MSPSTRNTLRATVTASVAALAVALGSSGGIAAASSAPGSAAVVTAEQSSSLPVFEFSGIITDKDTMIYNPTNEYIFPSIFHAGAYLDDPLGEWYLYLAPHNSPAGVMLMYADSLDGPWTEYAENPIIASQWLPYYDVSHVSSPDAIWNEEAGEVFLYFHGENSTTRYASSSDGVTFEYGDRVVWNELGGPSVTETSYARVFEHPDPESEYRYAMFYMANQTDNMRRIRLAESVDGITWTVDPENVVVPEAGDSGNVSGANLWEWDGQLYVIYHNSAGNVMARTIDPSLREVGEAQILHTASGVGVDVGRTAAPEIVTDSTGTYLFYEAGDRLGATIAYATLNPDGVRPPDPAELFPVDPENPVFEQCAAPGSDEFEGTSVDPAVWDRVIREASARHSVAAGVLTIPTYTGGVAAAPLLQQEVPEGPWQVTTKVTIDVFERFQQAGLLLYASDTVYGKFDLGQASGGKTLEVVRFMNGSSRQDTGAPAVPEADTVWLRLTSDTASIQPSVSYDGETFTDYGRPFSFAETPFTHIGPYAFRGLDGTPEVEAQFDWFRWTPTVQEYEACMDAEAPGDAPTEVDELGALLAELVASGEVSGPLAMQLTTAVQQADRHVEAARSAEAAAALGRFLDRLGAPKYPDTVTEEASAALEAQVAAVLSLLS